MVGRQIAYLERFRDEIREITGGRKTISENQVRELEERIVKFLGHNKMSRWIYEGAGRQPRAGRTGISR
jgi:hypothetical protein